MDHNGYLELVFGLSLDNSSQPEPFHSTGGALQAGPQKLLLLLESHLGLANPGNDNEYLRIEQYRQALRRLLELDPGAFFARSFTADPFATAADLLDRRDELLLAGWNFIESPDMPGRLRCLARMESWIADLEFPLAPGYADRFVQALALLPGRRVPFRRFASVEPESLLPQHIRRLLAILKALGVEVAGLEPVVFGEQQQTDLGVFRHILSASAKGEKVRLRGDGSLVLVRGKRDTELAAFLAGLFRRNPDFKPALLLPDQSRALDNALVQEGLPALGIQSTSLARPTLQVLKLAPAFIWQPLNPFQVMEFVSLAVKPLEEELANRIAQQMAQTPGILGDSWQAMLSQYFRELEARVQSDPRLQPDQIRQQYRFWFERRRYDSNGTAPKEDMLDLYRYLHFWAKKAFEDGGSINPSMLLLSAQARKIVEFLEALPEERLTRLELERIVRTIYEAAPIQLRQQETAHLPFVHHPGALTGPVSQLVWWNFSQLEPDFFFSRWYQEEIEWLAARAVALRSPVDQNALLMWQRRQPVVHARERLVLFHPEYVEGTAVQPHPLLGDLEAAFENLDVITTDLDARDTGFLARFFALPDCAELPQRSLGRPEPFIKIPSPEKLEARLQETFSSLETLFYYPYQWVFRHKILLRKSSILSIVKDSTLLGNLAHRFFEELLLQPDLLRWTQPDIEGWIDQVAPGLLQKEGSVLLLYGREPERVHFLKQIKYAAWSLVQLIQVNGWTVAGTEKTLEGAFLDIGLTGRADLVLQRGKEWAVIDLKWRGLNTRVQWIANEEDLQLVLYAYLLNPGHTLAHTAYFIIENYQMVARNYAAFKDINAVSPNSDHTEVYQRIMRRMEATYRWRVQQIRSGLIEVRCKPTLPELEEFYQGQLLELLEMKKEESLYDDYRTLINLVN